MGDINISERGRNTYFDFLRGVAIIMVIGQHTCQCADFSFANGFNPNILLMEIIKVAVPIFLAISGYFLCAKRIDTLKDYGQFLKNHLLRIYIPLYIFSIPFIFGNGLALKSIVGRTVLTFFGYYSVYYFIFLIAQYYILLPIIKAMMKSRIWGLVVCGTISFVAIAVVVYYKIICGIDIPLYIYAGPFPVWLIFFALGCWLRLHGRDYNPVLPIALVIVGLILSYLESAVLTINYSDGLGIKPSVFFYSAFALVVLFQSRISNWYNTKIATTYFGKIMEIVGRMSFTIYLIHLYVYNIFRLVQSYILPPEYETWIVDWLSAFLLSTLVTCVLYKIVPNKCHKYIGL